MSEAVLLENAALEVEMGGASDPKNALETVIEDDKVKDIKKVLPIWARPPWPEWSDEAINVEMWEENVHSLNIIFIIFRFVWNEKSNALNYLKSRNLLKSLKIQPER